MCHRFHTEQVVDISLVYLDVVFGFVNTMQNISLIVNSMCARTGNDCGRASQQKHQTTQPISWCAWW